MDHHNHHCWINHLSETDTRLSNYPHLRGSGTFLPSPASNRVKGLFSLTPRKVLTVLTEFIPSLRRRNTRLTVSTREPWDPMAPVEINLSTTLCAHLTGPEGILTCGQSDWVPAEVWDEAGRALTRNQRLRVWHRHSQAITKRTTPGIQLAVSDIPATSALAHPALFTVVNDTATALLGEAATYFAPADGVLVACRFLEAEEVSSWAFTAFMKAKTPITPFPIFFRGGFPVSKDPENRQLLSTVRGALRRSRL